MTDLKEYIIPIKGLKDGEHQFDFIVGKAFFNFFEREDIDDANVEVWVDVIKTAQVIEFLFDIDGVVVLPCDRCLESVELPVSGTANLYLKFGEHVTDITDVDDVMVIDPNEGEFSLAQHIYEYISLHLPFKRVHPDDENGEPTCDPEMLDQIRAYTLSETEMDPRWANLQKLMNNN